MVKQLRLIKLVEDVGYTVDPKKDVQESATPGTDETIEKLALDATPTALPEPNTPEEKPSVVEETSDPVKPTSKRTSKSAE